MTQGTISILIGCHSPIHSIMIVVAWCKLYKRFPKFWELVCIFLHDIGHYGLNYLDDFEQKKRHWVLGANIANKLFGKKGYDLLAGHCSHSGHTISALYKADKYSWHLAPCFWLRWNNTVEPKLRMGYTSAEAVRLFKAKVKQSVESGEYTSTHLMYLEKCQSITGESNGECVTRE